MLTDRQEKIKEEIEALLLISSSASVKERKYLKESAISLRMSNPDFKRIINKLLLNLEALEKHQAEGLTIRTETLFKKLVLAYGMPPEDFKKVDWRIRDADYEFAHPTGSPFSPFGQWKRKNEKRRPVFIQILFVLAFMTLIFSSFYLLFPWMLKKLGGNYNLGVIAFGLLVIICLIYFGSFKRDKRGNNDEEN